MGLILHFQQFMAGVRDECVGDDKSGLRSLTIYPQDHRRWLANRAANQSEEHKQAQKRRMVWENAFGHGSTYHHGDKAPYRSQPMNEIAEMMTVIAINLNTASCCWMAMAGGTPSIVLSRLGTALF